MIIILCLDDANGMMFNQRRQSKDSMVRKKLLELCGDKKLWVNNFSAQQFDEDQLERIKVQDDFLDVAEAGDYCFVENNALLPYEKKIEKLILFKWNRLYPADMKLDITLAESGWRCITSEEFQGTSHKKISMEVYEK